MKKWVVKLGVPVVMGGCSSESMQERERIEWLVVFWWWTSSKTKKNEWGFMVVDSSDFGGPPVSLSPEK
ncbi:hypothetical protein KY285_004904 [Solanum tuberosum]|nr:hypothetical protein KY285_004904 [Solanum tuberosum]